MPSYFLHIGTHKTGSTAIQNYLFKIRKTLEEAAFCYPEIGLQDTGHHKIAWAAATGKNQDLRQYIDGINAQCEQTGIERVILSSEEFEFIRDPQVLLEILPPNTRIILYLRRPDSYLESEYNQHVRMYKLRFDGDIFRFYLRRNFLGRCMYADLSQRWAHSLGHKNLTIISYDKARETNSLFLTLHKAIGIPYDARFQQLSISEQNLGMSAPAIYYLARLNQLPLDTKSHHRVAAEISKHFNGQPKQTMLTQKDRSILYRDAHDQIKSIEQRYRLQLFAPPDADVGRERPFCDFALLDASLLESFLAKAKS